MKVRCQFCREELDGESAYRRVLAWERKATSASRRGGSDIALREPHGESFACQFCIESMKKGRSPQQGALL